MNVPTMCPFCAMYSPSVLIVAAARIILTGKSSD